MKWAGLLAVARISLDLTDIYTPNRIGRNHGTAINGEKFSTSTRRVGVVCCPRIAIKITFVPFRAINVRPDDPIFTLAKEPSAPSRLEISKINIEWVQQTLNVLDQTA